MLSSLNFLNWTFDFFVDFRPFVANQLCKNVETSGSCSPDHDEEAPDRKIQTNPKSPKVFHYSHHFLFFKSLNFSHFFPRNIFRFKISEKAQESSKLKKLGLRKMPEHCNKVLNLHKQVNICCLFSQLVKPENLAPKSLKKRAMNTT